MTTVVTENTTVCHRTQQYATQVKINDKRSPLRSGISFNDEEVDVLEVFCVTLLIGCMVYCFDY